MYDAWQKKYIFKSTYGNAIVPINNKFKNIHNHIV